VPPRRGTITPGLYYLRVKSSAISGVTEQGQRHPNQFSLRATNGAGAAPTGLRALRRERHVDPFDPGRRISTDLLPCGYSSKSTPAKKLKIDLFDPGRPHSGNVTMTIKPPGGGNITCTYTVDGSGGGNASRPGCGPTDPRPTANARLQREERGVHDQPSRRPTTATRPTANGLLVEDQRQLHRRPQATRTVWSATIIGDPVHLVE